MQAGEVADPEPNQPKTDSVGLLKNVMIVPIEVRVSDASTKGDLEEEELGPVYPPDPSPVTKLPSPPNVTSSAPPLSNSLPKITSSTRPSVFQEPDPDYDATEPGSRSTRKPREDWDLEPSPGRAVLGDRLDPPSSSVEKQGTEITRRKGSTKPPGTRPALEDGSREKADSVQHLKNSSALASLPGENLLEVSVEVRLVPDPKENWNHLVRLVMSSVQSMMQEELRAHVVPKSTSSVRIKRLSTGVLYIFWLQFGDNLAGLQVREMLNMALSRLQGRQLNTRGRKDSIAFATSEDINECGTQVALCDINADCFNRFGSYACRCKPGYEDKSRLGTGGTVCVAPTETGPAQSQPPSSSLLGCLFGLCFLLGIFVVLLLCIVGVLYRRHHRGAFIVPCHKRQHAGSESGADRNSSPLPPPPPPIRRPKDGWGNPKEACPTTDLPLLKFVPLAPSDGVSYKGQEEGDNL
ncbi:hypothetical protein GJAV_G00264670 [Gymnothorax javanicus]|nr:hypothetical protein GJAV_G00264670 [Gymnothorax javanicus]